jgi:DedD protein
MSTLYDRDNDLEDLHDSTEDREISLGTTTIIGIFFSLALLCAVFFGFGYSLGRKSAPATIPGASQTASAEVDADASKPSPGSPLTQSSANSQPSKQADTANQPTTTPDDSSRDTPSQTQPTPAPIRTVVVTDEHPAASAKVSPAKPVALTPVAITTASSGSAMVQVAAVSHQEDADILASALKKRGYTVAIRQVSQDKLLHVQVGPFANKKDADAMRLRLQTDGYNAIVK